MKHKTLNLTNEDVYFVGDVHGEYDMLMFGIKTLGISDTDILISVGDLSDRGARSKDCLEYFLNHPNRYSVIGNHEDMLIRSFLRYSGENKDHWLLNLIHNGGRWVLDYSTQEIQELAKKVSELPLAITVEHKGLDKRVGVCHAESALGDWDIFTSQLQSAQIENRAIWGRNNIKAKTGTPVKGVDLTIHGHTPKPAPVQKANQYWIDTGACFPSSSEFETALTIAQLTEDGLKFYRIERSPFVIGRFELV